MKITMVAVVSVNGKLTRGSDQDIYKWTSKEDQDLFFKLIQKSKLIVMGSGTYEAVRDKIKLESSKLRVILTNDPKKYQNELVTGSLEFTSETPRQLIERLGNYREALLVGGGKVYSSFIKEGLIDEIYLTVEPMVFGEGKNLFSDEDFETKLKLKSIKKLNEQGTVLLKYIVVK